MKDDHDTELSLYRIDHDRLMRLASWVNENRLRGEVSRLLEESGEAGSWTWVGSPANGCLEFSSIGPVAIRDLDVVRVRTRFEHRQGKYARLELVDVSAECAELLTELGLPFDQNGEGWTSILFSRLDR